MAPHGDAGLFIGPELAACRPSDSGRGERRRRPSACSRSLMTRRPDDLVLVLLSGGASALACLPGDGLTLAEKQALTAALLRSGAPIEEINCVRRHLSRIKGGRLALAAAPARLLTLAISDVIGDWPEAIGSGPTARRSHHGRRRARRSSTAYGLDRAALRNRPSRSRANSASSPARPTRLPRRRRRPNVSATGPLCSAKSRARRARSGRAHARLALAAAPGTALISGGELTVTVTGAGPGRPQRRICARRRPGAGRPRRHHRPRRRHGRPRRHERRGGRLHRRARRTAQRRSRRTTAPAAADLFVTGPTGTNVNDLRIILVKGDSYR